jgi:hypothetical protein
MAAPASPVGLSSISRALTAVTAVASGVVGLLLFVFPPWAAPRFAWQVTELMVMSIGAWFLGNCLWAARIARDWRWARWSSSLVYLWAFGALQLVVLLKYRAKVVTDTPLALLYLGVIGLMVVAAVVGAVDVVRLRPRWADDGPPMPRWLQVAVIVFILFVGFLFAVAILRPSAAVGGHVFPEDMTPLTVRTFGVYFLTLALAAVVVVVVRRLAPLLVHMEGGIGITVPILAASLVYLDVFDFGEHPGQWIYLGAYVAFLLVAIPTVVHYRRAGLPEPATVRRTGAHSAVSRSAQGPTE